MSPWAQAVGQEQVALDWAIRVGWEIEAILLIGRLNENIINSTILTAITCNAQRNAQGHSEQDHVYTHSTNYSVEHLWLGWNDYEVKKGLPGDVWSSRCCFLCWDFAVTSVKKRNGAESFILVALYCSSCLQVPPWDVQPCIRTPGLDPGFTTHKLNCDQVFDDIFASVYLSIKWNQEN